MDSSKMLIAHIATEVIVIGGVAFYLNKRISDLTTKVAELEKKLEHFEGCSGGSNGGIPEEEFSKFQQQTTNHLKNIYSLIGQITNDIGQTQNDHQRNQQPKRFVNKQERQDTQEMQERQENKQEMKRRTKSNGSFTLESQNNKKNVQFHQESLSLSPEPHHAKINIEVMDDDNKENKEIHEDDLNDELEDELRALSDDTNGENESNVNESSLKNDDINTSQETPLEFLSTKSKKSKKKL